MSVLSLGIVGSGDIARTAHAPVMKTLAGAKLAWVADVDAARAKSLGKAYQVPHVVLDSSGPEGLPGSDVVLLSIPYGVRQPYFETFRKRGTGIYVEKPFARSAEEHETFCSWFPEHSLTSGLMMRSWWANRMVRDMVDNQLFGPLKRVKFAHGRPGMVTYGRYYLDPAKGGGGMLAEFGIHGLDSMLFITRAQSAELEKVHTVWDGQVDLHTKAEMELQLASGSTAKAEILVTGIDDLVEGMELQFEHATLSYLLPGQGYALHGDQIDLRVSVQPNAGGPSYELTPRDTGLSPATKFQMFHHFWGEFLDGMRGKTKNDTNATEALLTTTLIERIGKAGAAHRQES